MKKSKHAESLMSKNGLDESPSHLLHRVLQIALDIYNEEAGEGALTQRQYAVLQALETGNGLSQTDLVKVTGIDRSTLAELVSRMLAKDLLARERSTTDARANLVTLADAGRAALTDMQPRVLAADEKILSLLSPPKRDSFVKLLRKLTASREEQLHAVVGMDSAARKEKAAADKAEKAAAKALKKAEKKKKPKKDKFSAKKLKKLPMPPLSAGADENALTEELVHAPVISVVK